MKNDQTTCMHWHLNPNKNNTSDIKQFSLEVVHIIRRFHSQIPGYKISPLKNLNNLARMFGVEEIWIKDEAERLALNSFNLLSDTYTVI